MVRRQFEETARYRGWQLLAGAIMANHVHLVVGVPGDPDPSSLLRDFKSYASRALNLRDRVSVKPRWWTEQGSKRKIADWDTLETVLRYVREQAYALEVWDAVNRDDAASGGRVQPAMIPPDRGLTPPLAHAIRPVAVNRIRRPLAATADDDETETARDRRLETARSWLR